jgi:hypothetical protein
MALSRGRFALQRVSLSAGERDGEARCWLASGCAGREGALRRPAVSLALPAAGCRSERGAWHDGFVGGLNPVPADRRTVLACGETAGWPWVLEAWRQPEDDRVYFAVRHRDQDMRSFQPIQIGEQAVQPKFVQNPDGDACVLCGPVADGVESVVVQPTRPTSGPAQPARLVGDATELGCFFVTAFEEAVEHASVAVEPGERWPRSSTFAINLMAQMRRLQEEAETVGEGVTPSGALWRLRVWIEQPGHVRVNFNTYTDAAEIAMMEKMGWGGAGGGHGGPMLAEGRLIKLSSWGGGGGERHVLGEIASSVAGVRVRLDDGTEVHAHVCRAETTEQDYFVAFADEEREPVVVIALDAVGEALGEEVRSEESLRFTREAENRRQGRT